MRLHQRIQNDLVALTELAAARQGFSYRMEGRNIALEYKGTPGLIRTGRGVEICTRWRAVLRLPPRYPIDPPIVTLSPVGQDGAPYHPNVLPVRPYALCYGRHLPDLLLDELARRVERMILLMPGSVTTDEADSLNHDACRHVRRLIREGRTPLTLGDRGRKGASQMATRGMPS
jgi:hypothetical protein